MQIVVATIRLRAEWCMSLKDKRSAVKRLLAGLRSKFNASACESGEQDLHRIIQLSVAALAFDRAQADSIAGSILGYVEGASEAGVLSVETEYR